MRAGQSRALRLGGPGRKLQQGAVLPRPCPPSAGPHPTKKAALGSMLKTHHIFFNENKNKILPAAHLRIIQK